MSETHVIVGAGLAGAKAAEALREEGHAGRIVLLGAEPERPYERPPLSKEYLRGESERAKVYVHDERFYESHGIELRTGTTVAGIDTGAAVRSAAPRREWKVLCSFIDGVTVRRPRCIRRRRTTTG